MPRPFILCTLLSRVKEYLDNLLMGYKRKHLHHLKWTWFFNTPVTMREEQQVAVNFRVAPLKELNPWWVTLRQERPQAHRLQNALYFCHDFTCSPLPPLSGTEHGTNGWREFSTACRVVLLSGKCLFYWAFLTCGLLWRWFPLQQYYLTGVMILYNNSISLSRILNT